ncbi:MAG: hypothetical protein FWC26_13585 [Fibromonadales bacterium]|nr:hypothetical protein [Fibromonadales bacterium]
MLDELSITQRDEINRLSLQLRAAYYNTHMNNTDAYSEPYGGKMTESIGAWPEFIFKGTFCKRSWRGLCSPCFYSRFPLSKINRSDYLNMVKKQALYVIDNFEKLVIKRQYEQASDFNPSVSLVLTPTGSFFDEFEFPIDIRLEMEQALVDIVNTKHIDINLHIESHCEDIIVYDSTNAKCKKEIELMKRLKTKIIFGFESVNEYARNILYNKNLSLTDFESAVNKVKSIDLDSGAFVFAGLFAYNDLQTHDDVISTVKYLINKSVFPVIMFQNAQSYTITDVLLKNKKITLIEPLTVSRIVCDILKLFEQNPSYWLIADPVGGPPEPDYHIFREAKITCKSCSDFIYEMLNNLRKTRDINAFICNYEKIKQCSCYEKYTKYIELLSNNFESIQANTNMLLQECSQSITLYFTAIGGKNEAV